jgi:hypothetical protein
MYAAILEVELTFMVDLENQHRRVSEFAQQTGLQYYNMLDSGYAAHDCTISSNLYKQSGNADTDDSTEPKGDIVIEMSGKYDFKVTQEVIEMMETEESKVIVNWLYHFQILKGSSDKYNLNKDYVKVLHK